MQIALYFRFQGYRISIELYNLGYKDIKYAYSSIIWVSRIVNMHRAPRFDFQGCKIAYGLGFSGLCRFNMRIMYIYLYYVNICKLCTGKVILRTAKTI